MTEMALGRGTWAKDNASLFVVILQNNFTALRKFSLYFSFTVTAIE
jgi:hypothetical protein